MSTLFCVIPFLIFRPAIAAPTGLQSTLATVTVPEVLRPLLQETLDFLNPSNSPSLKQTVISCLTFLFISTFILFPTPRNKARRGGISRLRYGLVAALYGLLSPDFAGYAAYRTALRDFFIAVGYNVIFRTKDRKKRWTGVHIAFLRHGGFVLQEDGKPNKVLSFDDLVRMVRAGEVERPDVSRADILAKSIHPPISRRIFNYLLYLPIYWFIKKFALKLPMVVVFVGLHAVLTWATLVLRSSFMTGIKGPIVVVRKSREDSHEEPALENDVEKLEGMSESKDSVDPAYDEKAVEEMPVAVDSNKEEGAQSITPSPDQTKHRQLGFSVIWLLSFPFKFVGLVLGVLLEFLNAVYSASKVLLKHHWAVIGGPCHLGTFGGYVAVVLESFMAWIGFVVLSWYVPYGVERKIWIVSSLFLLLQPVILLLARPQRIRTRIKESIKQVIFVLYTFVYVVARLSIPLAAMYSTRSVM